MKHNLNIYLRSIFISSNHFSSRIISLFSLFYIHHLNHTSHMKPYNHFHQSRHENILAMDIRHNIYLFPCKFKLVLLKYQRYPNG